MRFIWDRQNRSHLEQHGVEPAIAEAVFFAKDRRIIESAQGFGRYECEGSLKGRVYRLVFTALSDSEIYPTTCFPVRRRKQP
jgi:uncharacterized DUF497 family protein